jgi:hypothetical protein
MAYLQEYEIDWNTFKSVHAAMPSATLYYLQNDLQYVPFVIAEGTSPIVGQALYYVNVNRDPSSVSGPYAALASGAKASAIIQDITYTANAYGTGGNSITVQYTNDATAVGKEFVTIAGNAITVHIVSGKSTAQQVVTAVVGWSAYSGLSKYNSAASTALVSAVVTGSSGNPQTTQGPTSLTGGVAPVTVLSDWTNNYLSGATKVASFSNGVALEI